MVKQNLQIFLLITVGFGFPIDGVVYGQACCSGGVPISNFVGIRPTESGLTTLRAIYDGNYLGDYYTGQEKLGNTSVKRFSQTLFFQGLYGVNKRLTLNLMASYVFHSRNSTQASGNKETLSINGLGDALLTLQYQVIRKNQSSLYLVIGPKIPIGQSNLMDVNDTPLPPDLQPGTGSWDLVTGLGYIRTGILRPSISITSTFIGKFNSAGDRFGSPYSYGNDYQFLIGITDSFLAGRTMLNPGLLLRFWHTEQDRLENGSFPNTGGTWIYLAPSLSIQPSKNLSTFLSLEIPIYQDLVGTQLSTTIRFNVGIQFDIPGKAEFIGMGD